MVPVAIGALAVLALGPAACGGDDATESSPEENAELAGTWRTTPVTVDDMTRTLHEQGLEKWVARFEQNAPVSDKPTVLLLEIRDGNWDLYGQPRGGQREEIDYDARFRVDGDTVVVSHESDSNTYRWAIQGGALELTWLDTTYGRNNGIPEQVFQRALYMTAGFRRAG